MIRPSIWKKDIDLQKLKNVRQKYIKEGAKQNKDLSTEENRENARKEMDRIFKNARYALWVKRGWITSEPN